MLAVTVMIALIDSPGLLYAQAPQEPAIPQNAIVINLDSRGVLRLDREQIDPSNLTDRVRNISASRNEDTVVIVAAANAAFKEVVHTIEAVRAAGIDRVGILKAQPDGSIRESLPPVGTTVLSIDRGGTVRLNGKKLKVGAVAAQLQKAFKRHNDHTLSIRRSLL
jgi:biopolymer transport protein ExbD